MLRRAFSSSARVARARASPRPSRALRRAPFAAHASSATNVSTRTTSLAPYVELLERESKSKSNAPPLALCVGWFGAEVKYVRKYAEMYVDAWPACDAVVIAPPSAATLVPSVADAYASVVARAVRDVARDRDVVLHVASNGGFIFAGTLMLRERALFDGVKGVVFDCAPGDLRPDIVARALTAVVKGASATNAPAPRVFDALAAMLLDTRVIKERLRMIDEVWGKIDGASTPAANDALLNCPTMFVYSEADVLICPREIETFARTRERATGRAVIMRKFDTAGHCEIGRDHYVEYKAHVRDFMSSLFGLSAQRKADENSENSEH